MMTNNIMTINQLKTMQQPATNATGTQLKLVTNIQLTRRSLAWPTVSAALIPSVVAPRLRATGLPCIASPETMSSRNTQYLGTENNRFIDASGNISSILHQVAKPSGTHDAVEQYVHYFMNMKGASIMITTRQRNDDEVELHSTGTPMWTRSRLAKHYNPVRRFQNLA